MYAEKYTSSFQIDMPQEERIFKYHHMHQDPMEEATRAREAARNANFLTQMVSEPWRGVRLNKKSRQFADIVLSRRITGDVFVRTTRFLPEEPSVANPSPGKVRCEIVKMRRERSSYIEDALLRVAAWSQLRHTCIPPPLHTDLRPFFMCFVYQRPSRSLAEMMEFRQELMPMHRVIYILLSVALGLEYLHMKPTDGAPIRAHGNISPSTVRFLGVGHYDIVLQPPYLSTVDDMILADVYPWKLPPHRLFASPEYLSATTLADRVRISDSPEHDMYCMGHLFYYLLTTKMPYDTAYRQDYCHLTELNSALDLTQVRYPMHHWTTGALMFLMHKLLRDDPSKRMTSHALVISLMTIWQRYCPGEPHPDLNNRPWTVIPWRTSP